VMCEEFTISYKGYEHPWILVSMGPGMDPLHYSGIILVISTGSGVHLLTCLFFKIRNTRPI
jgi:hypothetical protein